MRILYKFLTSCRAARGVAPADTASCWPCPTDANMTGNWNVLPGFQTGTYGPLYPLQDATAATGVVVEPGTRLAPFANALSQNRPNPFNPETTIPYSLAGAGRVAIRIYGVGGRCIRTLVNEIQTSGPHVARWNGDLDSGGQAASGVYFYVIEYPDGSSSAKKMVMLR